MQNPNKYANRYSLNTSNVSGPKAESSVGTRPPSYLKLWSGVSNSPTRHQNLIDKNAPRPVQRVEMSPQLSSKSSSVMYKIDPRICIDVQSNGLASRIVKYHEKGQIVNRSLSMGNLYNKPGQYPVVHLKKREMLPSPRRNHSQQVPMVKIAPPDKSVYNAHTRSNILRTGSIVPNIYSLQSRSLVDGNYRENEPLIPTIDHDFIPTRSVLDELKEISRKRISHDSFDESDGNKKYCKPPLLPSTQVYRSINLNSSCQSSVAAVQQYNSIAVSKRQREAPISPSNSPQGTTDQIVKKRMYTKNNDISSSLSSSISINTPKRKLSELQLKVPLSNLSPDSPTEPQRKKLVNDANKISNLLVSSATFEESSIRVLPLPLQISSVEEENSQQKLGTVSAPILFSKPKLTLFNKKYDDLSSEQNALSVIGPIASGNIDAEYEDEDGSSLINFVKPRKSTPSVSGRNEALNRVKQTKLSLMLSCLSGVSDDEIDGASSDKDTTGKIDNLINSVKTAPIVDNLKFPTDNEHDSKEEMPATTTVPNANNAAAKMSNPQMNPAVTVSTTSTTIAPTSHLVASGVITSNTLKTTTITTTSTSSTPSFSFGLKSSMVTQPDTSKVYVSLPAPQVTASFTFGISSKKGSNTTTAASSNESISSSLLPPIKTTPAVSVQENSTEILELPKFGSTSSTVAPSSNFSQTNAALINNPMVAAFTLAPPGKSLPDAQTVNNGLFAEPKIKSINFTFNATEDCALKHVSTSDHSVPPPPTTTSSSNAAFSFGGHQQNPMKVSNYLELGQSQTTNPSTESKPALSGITLPTTISSAAGESIFSFGSIKDSTVQENSGKLLGSEANKIEVSANEMAFNFGGISAGQQKQQSAQAISNPFNFGGNNNKSHMFGATNSTSTGGFNFGAGGSINSNQPPGSQTPVKAFSFAGSTSAATASTSGASSNIFGTSLESNKATFSFSLAAANQPENTITESAGDLLHNNQTATTHSLTTGGFNFKTPSSCNFGGMNNVIDTCSSSGFEFGAASARDNDAQQQNFRPTSSGSYFDPSSNPSSALIKNSPFDSTVTSKNAIKPFSFTRSTNGTQKIASTNIFGTTATADNQSKNIFGAEGGTTNNNVMSARSFTFTGPSTTQSDNNSTNNNNGGGAFVFAPTSFDFANNQPSSTAGGSSSMFDNVASVKPQPFSFGASSPAANSAPALFSVGTGGATTERKTIRATRRLNK